MISVIIPTLNEENYLGKLLHSIKQQNFKDYEVIVVDAGSTDSTEKVASSHIFIQSSIKNVSKQRNIGAAKAKGDLLMFMDADIVIKDSIFFGKVTNTFKNPKISAATCKVRIIPKEENLFDRLFFTFTDFVIKTAKTGRGACQIVRKRAFAGYNESMAVGEDVDLFKRTRGKIHFMPSIVYESSRRYRKEGYLKIFWHWKLSWFSHLLGMPYKVKRKYVR